MLKIVTGFGKFDYNSLPMVMCASVDIFQDRLDDLISDIEGAKTYIDDILVLINDNLSKNIEQRMTIFSILRTAGLKVNAPKCSFGLKEIPYMGYVITQEFIKFDPKKL